MAGCAALLQYNLQPLFDKVDSQISAGQTVVMDNQMRAQTLDSLLVEGDYVPDAKDAAFISRWYQRRLKEESLPFLDKMMSDPFRIPADSVLRYGGESLNTRLKTDLVALGQDDDWAAVSAEKLTSHFGEENDSTATIKVRVENEEHFQSSSGDVEPEVSGIIVRLNEHIVQSGVPSAELAFSDDIRIVGYAVTDKSGDAMFTVPKGHYYSVLPIRKGYRYGNAQGTETGALSDDLGTLTFKQKEHRVRAFSPYIYQQLRKNQAIIVRTPEQFNKTLWGGVIIFIASWFVVFVCLGIMDKRHKLVTDTLIPLSLMALTGLGLLTLYGTMRPLSDTFYAQKMVWFIAVGCLLMVLISRLNVLKIFQKYRSLWQGKMRIGDSTVHSISYGYPFLIGAVILMVLLRFFGTGPTDSDARVNLIFFQPAEVVKYLIVIFMAIFFVVKGDVIRTFGARMTHLARRRHWVIVSVVVLAIITVSVLFLGLLKDMGPALVILASFILLYSVVRRDFPMLMVGIISYMVIVGATYMLTPSMPIRVCAVASWFALWILFGLFKSKTVYESAIFFNVLISMFLVGGYLIKPLLPNMAIRLFNRTNMAWSGIFDNAIPHGDQIAQGVWGMATGGFSGMGPGGGSSYLIPAGHTDLILSSLGEQFGWIGIILAMICFFVLITHTTSAAQYSGHKFTLYLCLGIGFITGVQFLFIALGSVGAIPLSGVPMPLMSYSGTSVIMALSAYGVVLSISRHRGSREALRSFVESKPEQRRPHADKLPVDFAVKEAKSLSRSLFAGMLLFFIGIFAVICFATYYQLIDRKNILLRPAITSTDKGLRVLSYNPRINQVIERLDRGNLYDRNGVLLATDDRTELTREQDQLFKSGADPEHMQNISRKLIRRYYPFGGDLVFITGDINRADVYTNFGSIPMGYLAENTNETALRGFDTHPHIVTLNSEKYKYNRFLDPAQNVALRYREKDYSVLLPALNQPLYRNDFITEFNASRQQRDLKLSVDAKLQTKLRQNIETHIKSNPQLNGLEYLRASVVVLDATNGELLSSANYPVAVTDSIERLREMGLYTRGGAPSEWRFGAPVTERDLGMTYQTAPGSTAKVITALAALRKLGTSAADIGFDIYPSMTVEPPSSEPNHGYPNKNRNGGALTYLEDAIKYSSNCYFIMLANEKDLYQDMGEIYWLTGISLANKRPYFFTQNEATEQLKTEFNKVINRFKTNGLKDYNHYMKRITPSEVWDTKSRRERMSSIQEFTGIAWGQSQLDASPLNMARVASIVVNRGQFRPTQYLLTHTDAETTKVADAESVAILANAMEQEADKWIEAGVLPASLKGKFGGKTGTPMRALRGTTIMNDGWYICYILGSGGKHNLAIALRLERLPDKTISTEAVHAVADAVLPALKGCGYI